MSDLHPFERAGLGQAPFHCISVRQNRFEIPGAGWKPGGCCNFCSTGILYEYVIKSADDRTFVVGSDCVRRTGAEVTGFREQRLQLARSKRETRRVEDRAARQARWAAERAERAGVFQNDSRNRTLITWLEETPDNERNSFRLEMRESLRQWGSLTDRQRDAAHTSMMRDAERARQQAASQWIGKIGEKLQGEFTITFTTSWESNFGWPRVMTYLTVMASEDNLFVYKGNRLGERGMKLRGTFTVKEHGERNGTKQTILSRPRKLEALS